MRAGKVCYALLMEERSMSEAYAENLRYLDRLIEQERTSNEHLNDEIRHLAVLSIRASVLPGTKVPRLGTSAAIQLAEKLDG